MNIINSEIVDEIRAEQVLLDLSSHIANVRTSKTLEPHIVIDACEEMLNRLQNGVYDSLFSKANISREITEDYKKRAHKFLSPDHIKKRIDIELNIEDRPNEIEYGFVLRILPQGTILHVCASNADALGAFSAIEGLLTGNINVVKLPKTDVFSAMLLCELMKIQPILKDFIYIFDFPSRDERAMKLMVECADCVAVWGGDSAIEGIRKLCPPNVKIVEWGHKISFAYATMDCTDEQLRGVAKNMCRTNGLYCTSCQGIFLDTHNTDELSAFAARFLRILHSVHDEMCSPDVYLNAQKTLEFCTERLEGREVYKEGSVGVIAYEDSSPITSYMFAHCWVKRLPRENILPALLPCKSHLQTVALLCEQKERPHIESVLLKCGFTRLFYDADKMSDHHALLPHDGVFALREYCKIVSVEL